MKPTRMRCSRDRATPNRTPEVYARKIVVVVRPVFFCESSERPDEPNGTGFENPPDEEDDDYDERPDDDDEEDEADQAFA